MNRPVSVVELDELNALLALGAGCVDARSLGEVEVGQQRLQLWSLALGAADDELPAIGFFGGVHGLERIGSMVVLAWLRHLLTRLPWDDSLRDLLTRVRLVFMPVVNPGGILRRTRANPQGVDLMRNAPVDADDKVPYLIGGQRVSARLPWFRGLPGVPMQVEAAALCQLVTSELSCRRFAVSVDCHSGFGMQDRIWFPYAHTRRPIEHLAELHALHALFEQSHPHHPYVFEPQGMQYLAHGDLWDFLHLQIAGSGRVFLPLTLEMGSWRWVRKNPRQLFSRQGIFNPQIAHRQQRVLRRHLPWLDFLTRATASYQRWLPQGEARQRHSSLAQQRWFQVASA
ncbi:M14 family zinc carboxypeptidase [Pseudomarimonas arenosa]|uniref:Zinc carboxypeptidase n=1 Tax=Pseudomarimonas arenosa TaxID=2774145 RepID=A0AAW3ZNZ8_9GAMM|nr:M14 family zinc carboxypeptidase [Pseudomarimonas arenosa]MBD8526645.1 zinc carboxypeptidase [Pseudomarimonas arenosa]